MIHFFTFKRLRHRIIFAFTMLLVVSLLANSLLAIWQVIQQSQEDYQVSVHQKMELLDHHIHYYAENIASNTRMLAEFPLIREADQRITSYKNTQSSEGLLPMRPMQGDPYEQEVYQILKTFQESHDSVKNASLGVEANGGFVMHPPRPRFNKYDARERQWYQKALESPGEVVISEIYTTSSGEKVVLCVMTVFDEKDQLRGVITVDFDLEALSNMLTDTTIGSSGYAMLTDSTGSILAYPNQPAVVGKSLEDIGLGSLLQGESLKEQTIDTFFYQDQSYRIQVIPSALAEFPLFYISFIHTSEFYQSGWILSRKLLLSAFFLLLFSMLLAYWLSGQLTGSLGKLREFADQLAEGNLSQRLQLTDQDEIGQLAQRFNEMAAAIEKSQRELESKVAERTFALSSTNEQLQETNEELQQTVVLLKNTQEQLIQSEKLAGLSTLVAGLAHEINTPLGGSISMASYLEHQLQQLLKDIEEETLGQHEFDQYMLRMQDSVQVLLRNLHRSSDLIQHFKQVAVDHRREEKREFYVKPYVEETLLGFQQLLKAGNHRFILDCEEKLSVYSFPGAFSQIIAILMQNSLEHGFADREGGSIYLSFQKQDHRLVVTYSDDGKGMTESVKSRIFEPFFTTARHQGNIGLGLHILYNLLMLQLKGDVVVESHPEQGTIFHLIWEP
ncbi:sensor histidine kinase [Tindallia californiensis]|uniref:histidine kinase n=1 Tax=Tindallia californiensis TaxID=159292 RepID=A0A1H3PWB4_9FIRM|nr:sensor histidine kinase [Tindallia californiensis]SDZ05125.1 Signal transduction histidine kinase regulating C4-dicarboxylate transport system [Tindallia californiensis]